MKFLVSYLVVQSLMVFTISATEIERKFHTVQTQSGIVRGESKQTLFLEKSYFAFKGIPYATPPVNELRFKVIYLYVMCVLSGVCQMFKIGYFNFLGSAKGRTLDGTPWYFGIWKCLQPTEFRAKRIHWRWGLSLLEYLHSR